MSYIHFIGIDVSKDHLDLAVHGTAAKPQRFPNSSAGFAALAEVFGAVLPQALVVLEATGGYETALIAALLARGTAVHRADPLMAKRFIQSLGKRAKTDALDALALARYAAERHQHMPLVRLPEEAQDRLNALQGRRDDLVAMRVAEQNRHKHPRYASLKLSVEAVLETLNAQISATEQHMAELIEQSSSLKADFLVLTGVKGIGRQTATTLLACMPELGSLTRKEAASLAGCAPHPRDSGKTTGYRKTAGGRATIKRALYMASLSACRHNEGLKTFYDRLIQNGKKPIVAMVAVMRKLITIINAKLRDAKNTQCP